MHPQLIRLSRNAYLALSVLLVTGCLMWVTKAHWSGDLFTHAAVVHELKQHPLHPSNPIVVSAEPHPFFSPFALAVAVVALALDVSAFTALAMAALFNLILFLSCFYYFVSPLTRSHRSLSAATCLLLVLFLWGAGAYNWSGFSHFACFFGVAPYPSTFSMALVFLAIGVLIRHPATPLVLLISMALSATILLSHPNTWVVLWPGFFGALCFVKGHSLRKSLIHTLLFILPGAVLAFFWPWFSITDLLLHPDPVFNSDSIAIFRHPLITLWPLVLAAPASLLDRNSRTSRFLVFNVTVLLAVYLLSYVTGHYGSGRTIAPAMVMMQVLVGVTLFRPGIAPKKVYVFRALVAACVAACLAMNDEPLKETVRYTVKQQRLDYYTRFQFVAGLVEPEEAVMAPLHANIILPAYGVKVVANRYPLHGIENAEARRKAVTVFFSDSATLLQRRKALAEHQSRFFIVTDDPGSSVQFAAAMGTLVRSENGVQLYRVEGDSE